MMLFSILLIFSYGTAIGEQNFLPLGLKINSDLNLINKLNSNPSCSFNNNYQPSNNQQAATFEDYAPVMQYQLKEDCLKEICPNIESNRKKSYEVDSPFSPKYKDLDSQLMPIKLALKKMLLAEAALEKDQNNRNFVKEFQNKSLPATPEVNLAIVNSMIREYLNRLTKARLLNSLNSSSVLNKYEKELVKLYSILLNPDDSSTVAAAVIKMSQDKRVAATGANDLGAPYRYKKQYPDLDYQKAVKRDLEETKQALGAAPREVKEVARLAGFDTKLNEQMEFTDSNRMVDEIDGQEIAKTTDQIQNMILLYKHISGSPELGQRAFKKQLELNKNMEYKKPLVLDHLTDNIEKKSLKDLLLPSPNNSKSELLYKDCLYSFAESTITLPSKNELDQFRVKLPEMRKTIEKAIQGKYSHVSGQILDEFIQKVPVYLPPEKDNYLSRLESQLNTRAQRSEYILNLRNKNILEASVIEALDDDEYSSRLDIKILKVCKNLSFRPVRDNTVVTIGGVMLGADSVKNEAFGLGVLAHELGHNMQDILNTNPEVSEESRTKHQKVERCLINQHQPFFNKLSKYNENKPQALQDARKPDHFLDEDYADLIGAAASDSNFYCEFGPDGLSWGPSSGDKDTHSSGLFRVLHIEAASNRKLPEKCQQLLQLNNYSLKKCF